jgi:translation initiation factor 2 beta subunit (eIF-2beta)/eIF-5
MDMNTTSSTMDSINITGTRPNSDAYFRYTMPSLSLSYEGRGNGKKTVLLNLKDVSDALDRPLETIVRYFSIELSAQCRKESDSSRVTINGVFTAEQLLHTLNTYIDTFVLCPKCHLPETLLSIKKDILRHKCKSCGENAPIPSYHHKLVRFIIKIFGS